MAQSPRLLGYSKGLGQFALSGMAVGRLPVKIERRKLSHYFCAACGMSGNMGFTPFVAILRSATGYGELGVPIGYLLGESAEAQMMADPNMVRRFQEINELCEEDKKCVFTLLDAFLAKNKIQAVLNQ